MGLHSGIFTLSVGGGSGEEGGGLDLRFFLGDSWANRVFHAQPQTGAYSCSFSAGNISSYQHQDNAHLKMSLPFTLIPKSFSSLCRREGRALRRGALIVGIPPSRRRLLIREAARLIVKLYSKVPFQATLWIFNIYRGRSHGPGITRSFQLQSTDSNNRTMAADGLNVNIKYSVHNRCHNKRQGRRGNLSSPLWRV